MGTAGDEVPEMNVEEGEFETDLGRKVFGGGGISPDVLSELPDGPQILTALFAHNAYFAFAVDYHEQSPVPDQSWQPPPGILDEFRDWVVAEEVTTAEALDEMFEDEEARAYSLRQIHANIFNAAFGPEASHQVLSKGDAQIQAALELFDDARALLERRTSLEGRSDLVASKPSAPETEDGLERPN